MTLASKCYFISQDDCIFRIGGISTPKLKFKLRRQLSRVYRNIFIPSPAAFRYPSFRRKRSSDRRKKSWRGRFFLGGGRSVPPSRFLGSVFFFFSGFRFCCLPGDEGDVVDKHLYRLSRLLSLILFPLFFVC